AAFGHLGAHLLGGQRDGGERRAQLMGGGGGQAIERRKLLAPGQGQFRRRQGIGDLAGIVGHAIGIGGDEHHAANDRHPDADDIDAVEGDGRRRIPGQGQVHHRDQRGQHAGQERDQQRLALGQGGGGHRNRRQQQQRERVLQAPRQRQEARELAEIEGQLQGGDARRQ